MKDFMNHRILVIGLGLASFVLAASAQEQPSQKAPSPQNQTSDTRVFGQSYATLRPGQKHLMDDFVRRLNQVTGSQMSPEQAYDGARMSLRTTFDAVTHALLTTKLTNDQGKNLGRVLDLVDAVRSLGRRAGTAWGQAVRYVRLPEPQCVRGFSGLLSTGDPDASRSRIAL